MSWPFARLSEWDRLRWSPGPTSVTSPCSQASAWADLFSQLLIVEPGAPTYVEDEAQLEAYAAAASALFGPVVMAVQRGELLDAGTKLVNASVVGGKPFNDQPHARRRIVLDNLRTLPRLISQAPPTPLSCSTLGRLSTKARVIWGEHTSAAFSIPARAAAQCIGGYGHEQVAGVGHLWPEEDPERFAAYVESWLAA